MLHTVLCSTCYRAGTQSCLFATPWTAARQASLSTTISRSLLKRMSINSVVPSNCLRVGVYDVYGPVCKMWLFKVKPVPSEPYRGLKGTMQLSAPWGCSPNGGGWSWNQLIGPRIELENHRGDFLGGLVVKTFNSKAEDMSCSLLRELRCHLRHPRPGTAR